MRERRTRRRLNACVALEAVKGERTVSEPAARKASHSRRDQPHVVAQKVAPPQASIATTSGAAV